jgi:hypothetical protein
MSPKFNSSSIAEPRIPASYPNIDNSSSQEAPSSSCGLHNIILEPTPMANRNIKVVDQVHLNDSRFFREQVLRVFPLFQKGGEMTDIRTSKMADVVPYELPLELCSSSVEERWKSPVMIPVENCRNEDVCKSHSEKWSQRFRDLLQFREEHGHCLVPLDWPKNPSLAHWIKHQRCQYKARVEGKHSTLTEERQSTLEKLGFVWDSHRATWEERFNEISFFREIHGHCNVPSKYQDSSKLSTWLKCQRRQYKLILQGKKSHMTQERIQKLSSIGFVWFPRQRKQQPFPLKELKTIYE